MAESGTAQPPGWRSWVREVARGWLLYALAITAVALAARARNIWLLAACSGVLAAASPSRATSPGGGSAPGPA